MYPDQEDVRKYAELLGCQRRIQLFDGGATVVLTHTASGVTWRGSYNWGDDEPALIKRAMKWLHTLPWPTEDDPRVENAGAYTA